MTTSKLSQTFSAMQHPNFRLWFIGQIVSLVGTWMQSTAQGYLIYQLTHSAAYLGIVGFAGGLPTWLFTLYGGVIADRISRRKLIIITQTSMLVLAFILAFLTFTNVVQPWHIVVLAFLLGIANAFDAPARQSFIFEMVDRADLTNAIALNSTIFNLGTVIGPAVAGLIYAWLGPGWCFTINGISFIAVIFALLLMKIAAQSPQPKTVSPFTHLKEGLEYVIHEKNVRLLLINLAVISTFGFSLMTLMPAWAVKILGGDVTTNGLLLSARGVGSLFAALFIAYLGAKGVRGKIWTVGWLMMPFFLAGFAFARWLPGSLALMVGVGWCLMSIVNITNSMIQTQIPDNLRGRVMGVYTLVFMGTMPIGSLLVGALATKFGETQTVLINSVIVLLVAFATFIFQPGLRKLH